MINEEYITELKKHMNNIEIEQTKRDNKKLNITLAELEILRMLLNKLNTIYGLEVRNTMTDFEKNIFYYSERTISEYIDELAFNNK